MAALPASGICGQIGPSAGTWKTWVTPAVSQIRFAALPNAATSVAENPTMKRLMAEAADTSAQGAYRDAGSFGYTSKDAPCVAAKCLFPEPKLSALTANLAVWHPQGWMPAQKMGGTWNKVRGENGSCKRTLF